MKKQSDALLILSSNTSVLRSCGIQTKQTHRRQPLRPWKRRAVLQLLGCDIFWNVRGLRLRQANPGRARDHAEADLKVSRIDGRQLHWVSSLGADHSRRKVRQGKGQPQEIHSPTSSEMSSQSHAQEIY